MGMTILTSPMVADAFGAKAKKYETPSEGIVDVINSTGIIVFGVAVTDGDGVGVGVRVTRIGTVPDATGVFDTVTVGEGEGVGERVGVRMVVGVALAVAVAVAAPVDVAVGLAVGVAVLVGAQIGRLSPSSPCCARPVPSAFVGQMVIVVAVAVGVGVREAVAVAVAVGDCEAVAVAVGVALGRGVGSTRSGCTNDSKNEQTSRSLAGARIGVTRIVSSCEAVSPTRVPAVEAQVVPVLTMLHRRFVAVASARSANSQPWPMPGAVLALHSRFEAHAFTPPAAMVVSVESPASDETFVNVPSAPPLPVRKNSSVVPPPVSTVLLSMTSCAVFGVGPTVGVAVAATLVVVGVAVGVASVGSAVVVAVAVAVGVAVDVGVGETVVVGVDVGVLVGVADAVGVGIHPKISMHASAVAVGVDAVLVPVGVAVPVKVEVGVPVTVGVIVGVAVGDTVGVAVPMIANDRTKLHDIRIALGLPIGLACRFTTFASFNNAFEIRSLHCVFVFASVHSIPVGLPLTSSAITHPCPTPEPGKFALQRRRDSVPVRPNSPDSPPVENTT